MTVISDKHLASTAEQLLQSNCNKLPVAFIARALEGAARVVAREPFPFAKVVLADIVLSEVGSVPIPGHDQLLEGEVGLAPGVRRLRLSRDRKP